ncbi:hypothetical protein pb186bvf_004575 [Paramecium bursaria]
MCIFVVIKMISILYNLIFEIHQFSFIKLKLYKKHDFVFLFEDYFQTQKARKVLMESDICQLIDHIQNRINLSLKNKCLKQFLFEFMQQIKKLMLALFHHLLNIQYVVSYMILSGADLQGLSLNIQNWKGFQADGQIMNYDPTSDVKCQIQLFPLKNSYQIYQKTYYLTSDAFDQVYIEFEVYFIEFISCIITILVNSQHIYQKQFNNLEITNICGELDSQYTFFIPFYGTSKTLIFQVKYEQINNDNQSYLGIRNLNIYTNGIPQINGCPFEQPFVQTDGTCVSVCNNGCQYLSGPQLGYCTNDISCGSKLLNTYLTSQQIWKLATTPSILEKTYLTQISTTYYLINNNQYANIMQSQLFVSPFGAETSLYYFLQQSILSTKKLQISFTFYIFGDWDDGSTIGLNIQGSSIYVNNVVNISKSRNIYITSTGSSFYQRNITNQNGQSETIWQTLITYQSNFYASSIKIGFTQCLYSTSGIYGSYGFSDIQIYQADSDPNALLYGLFGLPYSCQSPYFAYLGTCIPNCPTHTRISIIYRNCTDYLFTESKFLNSSLIISGYARYVVKQYHNQNFQQSDINELFTIFPLNYMNFQNGQQYSFVGNKKILGGYNCWGSGTYGLQATAFSSHYQMRLYFKLYMIDDWQINDTFSVYVDGAFIQSYSQVKTEQLAGTQSLDQQLNIDLVIAHTMKQVQILFVCTLNVFDSTVASCGISDLFVLIDKNSDIQCSGVNSYYSFFTGRCEKCNIAVNSRCLFYPTYNPYSNKCANACVNCQTTSICLACDAQSGFHLTSNSCTCRDGFVASNAICFCTNYLFIVECHYSCLTCTGQKNTNCQSPCPATRIFSNNQCLCNQNYVDVYNLKDCQLIISNCHYTCSTCYGSQYYNCLTCPDNSFRQLIIISSTSVCQCIANFIEQWQNPICKFNYPCHVSCLTCQGFLSTDCLTCKLNYILIGNSCICPNGYNILNAQQDCVQNSILCHQTCLTCIDNYQDKCISCDSQRQLLIENQLLFQFSCQCIDGYYDQNNICQLCELSCLTCTSSGPTNCLTCDSNKLRIKSNLNQCQCQSGYNDNLNEGTICVINLTTCHYSCNVCFGLAYDQCIECVISSNRQLNLNSCQCKSGYFEDGQQICLQCNQTCFTCIGNQFDQCLSCDIRQYRIFNGNRCECIQGYNDKLNLTCHQNFIPCHLECDTCYGYSSYNCLTCRINSYLTSDDSCECNVEYVKVQSQCIDCQTEQGMITYECQYKNSNDGVWTYGEQCDNGRNNQREACYNNIIQKNYGCTNIIKQQSICYKCPDHCIKCNLINGTIICSQCEENYFNEQISCVQCNEETCLQCNSPRNCIECKNNLIPTNGQCLQCKDQGHYPIQDKCQSICGDGIKTDEEECDDGNLLIFDGCDNYCKEEQDYTCSQALNQLSNCQISLSPSLTIRLSKTDNNQLNQYVQQIILQTDQKVYHKSIQLIYQIENCDNSQMDYLNKNQQDYNYLLFDIQLKFKQSCENITITFIVEGQVYNQYNQNLTKNSISITLDQIIVLNDDQIEFTKSTEFVGSSILTSFAFLSVSSLMLGGVSQLIQFLNLISQILYLQYVDIELPPNLYQFLDIFNSLNMNQLFSIFSISNLLITFEKNNYFNSQPKQRKFQQYDLNSYFFANMNGFIFSILSGLFSQLMTQIFITGIQKFQKIINKQNSQLQYILGKIKIFLHKSSVILKKIGLFQITLANCYDVQFAILLQISNQKFQNLYSIANTILAYNFLIMYYFIIGYTQNIDDEFKGKKIWQQSFSKFKLLEAFIFQVSIVLLQFYPQCQVMLISLTSLTITIYVQQFDPYSNKLNTYKIIFQEFILFLVTLTFNIYIYFPTNIDNIKVGWFHIALLLIMLILSLLVDLYSTFLQLKKILLRRS